MLNVAAYDRAAFQSDLMAGVSVAAVAVPIAIAYSQVAGVPAVNGLYASILPLVAYAFVGSSRQLIMAPDAATCTLVAATVLPLAGNDASRYVSLTMTLAIFTGVFCIAAGLLRLGFFANFLSRPILTGYLNGIAISIISGQLGKLFGIPLPSSGFFRLVWHFLQRVGETHALTLATGAAIFALLRVMKRVAPRIPAPLAAVVVAIAAAQLLDLGRHGVALLGTIPAGFPRPMMPDVREDDLVPLALGAVGLALISYNSAMVTARSFAVKNRYEIDSNREFVALGIADIGAGLLQGFAISGADSRTAVNDSVGGRTQVTGLVAAAVITLVLLFLTVPLARLPIAALSAILVNSALGLFDVPALRQLRRIQPREFRLAMVTLLGVITVGVLPGVVVAVAIALGQLLARASRPEDAILGRVPGSDAFVNSVTHPDVEMLPDVVIYRFDAPLVFFNADHFKSRVRSLTVAAASKPRSLIIDFETTLMIDVTASSILGELIEELGANGIRVAIAAPRTVVRLMLERTGLDERIGPGRVFPSVAAAVKRLDAKSHRR
jgi:high affinity sulfate transporter 1